MAASLNYITFGHAATYTVTVPQVAFGAGVRVVWTTSHSPAVVAANHPLTIGGVDAVLVATQGNMHIWVLPEGPAANLDVVYNSATWGGWCVVECFTGVGFASETPVATAGEGLASQPDPHTMTNPITVNPNGTALLIWTSPEAYLGSWSMNDGGTILSTAPFHGATAYVPTQEPVGTYQPSWNIGGTNTSTALVAIWDGAGGGGGPVAKPRGYAAIIG